MQDVVRTNKVAYKRLLNQGSEEASLAFNEIKKDVKSKVRKAKNDMYRKWLRMPRECRGGSGQR